MRYPLKPASLMLAVVAAALLANQAHAANIVVLSSGKKVAAESIVSKPSGELLVTRNGQTQTLAPTQYKMAITDEPVDFKKAEALKAAGKNDEAITLYDQVMRKNIFLTWDGRAAARIADIHLAADKAGDAKKVIDLAIKRDKNIISKVSVLQLVQWKTLAKLGDAESLEPVLKKAISGGDRELAATAQILRGDLRTTQGKHKQAVLDYLRTVVFFKQQTNVQPEALFKAASSLETLKDSKRAKKFYTQLVAEYPDSSFAADAKGKI